MYPGLTSEYDMMHQWSDEKCFPAVRELTFENAEVGKLKRILVLCCDLWMLLLLRTDQLNVLRIELFL